MELTKVYVGGIVKFERAGEDLVVYGQATGPELDRTGQICDPAWLRKAMPAWAEWANVREQHSSIAAGVGLEVDGTSDGDRWWLKTLVTDPVTVHKVETRTLKGYSIGIKNATVVKDSQAPNGRIVGGDIVEISLVDTPANPACSIDIAKSLDGTAGLGPVGIDGKAVHGHSHTHMHTDGGHSHFHAHASSVDLGHGLEDHIAHHHQHDGDEEALHPVSKSLEAELVKRLLKAAAEGGKCALCKGKGKIRAGKVKCPDCDGSGEAPGTEKPGSDQPAGKSLYAELVEDIVKRDFSDDERKQMAAKGQAMPGGGFPIANVNDLKNAIQAIGRAKDPSAAKAHIKARAEALGASNLVPDDWKALVADLVKKSDDEWTHDPAVLASVRQGLVDLLKAELDELCAGEDEIWDIQDLVQTLCGFLSWWRHESYEGETPSPTGPQNGDDQLTMISLGLDPDIVKAATAEDATDESRAALRAELVKNLEIESIVEKTAKAAAGEVLSGLEERLQSVEAMAAPGAPARARTQLQAEKAAEIDRLESEIARLTTVEKSLTGAEPELRKGYRESIAELRKELEAARAFAGL